jgi:hypothetical protein
VRVENRRHEIRYWAVGWPEELGPTFVIVKKPSQRAAGRPRTGVEGRRRFLRLRIATAVHEARGEALEAAIAAAMHDLDCLGTAAETDRIRTRFRRAKDDIRQRLRLGE